MFLYTGLTRTNGHSSCHSGSWIHKKITYSCARLIAPGCLDSASRQGPRAVVPLGFNKPFCCGRGVPCASNQQYPRSSGRGHEEHDAASAASRSDRGIQSGKEETFARWMTYPGSLCASASTAQISTSLALYGTTLGYDGANIDGPPEAPESTFAMPPRTPRLGLSAVQNITSHLLAPVSGQSLRALGWHQMITCGLLRRTPC